MPKDMEVRQGWLQLSDPLEVGTTSAMGSSPFVLVLLDIVWVVSAVASVFYSSFCCSGKVAIIFKHFICRVILGT